MLTVSYGDIWECWQAWGPRRWCFSTHMEWVRVVESKVESVVSSCLCVLKAIDQLQDSSRCWLHSVSREKNVCYRHGEGCQTVMDLVRGLREDNCHILEVGKVGVVKDFQFAHAVDGIYEEQELLFLGACEL